MTMAICAPASTTQCLSSTSPIAALTSLAGRVPARSPPAVCAGVRVARAGTCSRRLKTPWLCGRRTVVCVVLRALRQSRYFIFSRCLRVLIVL